jgi:hypothetical protein
MLGRFARGMLRLSYEAFITLAINASWNSMGNSRHIFFSWLELKSL